MFRLETDRLWARPITELDYPLIRAVHGDPRCAPQLSMDGPHIPEEKTRAYLQWALGHWHAFDFGPYLFYSKDDGRYCGFAGLRNSHLDQNDVIALSYCVCSQMWGRGFGTEMSKAVLDEGFSRLGFAHIVAITFPHHQASRRVLEKSGLACTGTIHHGGLPHVFYRIERDPARACS